MLSTAVTVCHGLAANSLQRAEPGTGAQGHNETGSIDPSTARRKRFAVLPERPFFMAALAAFALVVTAAGCGATSTSGSHSTTSRSTASKRVASTAGLPAAIVMGSDVSYAPMEYYEQNGTTPTGLEVELAKALGKRIGIPVEIKNISFDGLIPALENGRVNITMSDMTDTKPREKVVNFIDYMIDRLALMVPKGNPKHIVASGPDGLGGLCGMNVAAQTGETNVTLLEKQSAACTKAGKQAIHVLATQGFAEDELAVRSGRADAAFEDLVGGLYAAKITGAFTVIGTGSSSYNGIGVGKQSTKLQKALVSALSSLMADGTYARLYAKYGLSPSTIKKVLVNHGINVASG